MDNIKPFKAFNEELNPNNVECTKCGWTWKLQDGGDDVFVCHKCNHDNTPVLGEDEDLLKDLTNIGFDPSIGFMFLGITSPRGDDRPLGFLVKGKDEKTCVKMIIESMKMDNPFITSKHDSVPKNSTLSFDSMTDLMVFLFEQGYVTDSGYYGPFKAKDSSQELILMVDEYMINAKDFVDLAYKHFTNVEEAFREAGHAQKFKYTPKDLGL